MDYYALDLDRRELERTLAQLPDYHHVRAHGLWGTYDDGRDWLKQPANVIRQKCVVSLGSSIGKKSLLQPSSYANAKTNLGNFHRDDASDFLRTFSSVLSPRDTMLIGLDSCADPAKV